MLDGTELTAHKNNVKAARQQYEEDRDNTPADTAVYTLDLQKVIMLPR